MTQWSVRVSRTTMNKSRIDTEASRLIPLASEVLNRYALQVKSVKHLATHSNVLYRVVTEDGRQLVLRVGSPSSNSRTNIQYEVDWLEAINRDTDLDVVSPIRTVAGRYVTDIQDPKTEDSRHCVLFSWVPGQPLGDGAGTFSYRLLGRMSAQLQAHGRAWLPDDPAELRHWDRIFYYGTMDPKVLFSPRYEHIVDRSRRVIINKALPVAERVVHLSWATSYPQIVHGDLHEWNAHVIGTRLYAFDFEDVMYATPAQDVSISLYSSRSSKRSAEIMSAFREGYEEFGVWPIVDDEQLDGLHAARQIMLMNYAVRTLPEDEAIEYLDKVMPWLKNYVDRYA
jgi:Ser/Thr protein kinase RdoA (MazF antagonist)